MPEARVGKAIHEALEQALLGKPLFDAVDGARATLASEHETARFESIRVGIQPFIERIDEFRRRRRVSRQLIEFPIAVRENLTPTTFYAGDAFYRGILDAGYIFDEHNIALVDHKTGERVSLRSITEQLQGYAVLTSLYFRQVRRFWLGVHWVGAADVEWERPVHISEVNQYFLPNVLANIEAAALAVEGGPRPNPGTWCESCTYRSICPVGQEMRFEPVDDEEPEPWA